MNHCLLFLLDVGSIQCITFVIVADSCLVNQKASHFTICVDSCYVHKHELLFTFVLSLSGPMITNKTNHWFLHVGDSRYTRWTLSAYRWDQFVNFVQGSLKTLWIPSMATFGSV